MRRVVGFGLAAAAAFVAAYGASASDKVPDGDWRTINRDLAATRYSPLDEINRSNVSQLSLKWSYAMKGFNTAAPLVIDLVRLAAVAQRRGEGGSMPHLACFFKSPIGVGEHDFGKQFGLLEAYAANGRC